MGASSALRERASAHGLTVELIGNSHGHIDHIYDNAPLKRASGASIAIHADDAYRLSGENVYGFEVEPSQADRLLHEGEQLRVGELIFDVLHTPGHTEGSVCLYEERHGLLLSGDVLFRGSYGRTDLRGGDDQAMVDSLRRIASELPPETRVLPGHGPETMLGKELTWLRRIAEAGRLLIPG
jgi:glyoxylase-like metal-dependent hydrolase (beta-lactamase superfamily II)